MQFSSPSYIVEEGTGANVVVTLESNASNPDFGFTVTVFAQDGSATCETVILALRLLSQLFLHSLFCLIY